MSEEYSRQLMKVSVAKMLQTIGWNSIQSTPLEILTDILIQYTTQLAKSTHDYANEFGCVDPSLDHVGLAFRDFHINLNELEEYTTFVNFAPAPTSAPKFPLPKDDNLNFLKPGSKEVVTRPVHIHEHLPPMHQINEDGSPGGTENRIETSRRPEENGEIINIEPNDVFKRPAEVSPSDSFKRPKLLTEEEGRPTREITSVMMTTSGYISPAREGKLPESRTPIPVMDPPPPPVILHHQNSHGNFINAIKIHDKGPPSLKKSEKKRDKIGKELFKPFNEEKMKKVTSMKDVAKFKQNKAGNSLNNLFAADQPVMHPMSLGPMPLIPPPFKTTSSNVKMNKALAAARLKTEKLNTTITPITVKPPAVDNVVDKLFTEPDKRKINIIKKISNVKNEKLETKIMKIKEDVKQEIIEPAADLVIDERADSKLHISNDITIELIENSVNKLAEKSEKPYFDDDSPPGTPSTPKTPEISQSPPINKHKRKRKDTSKVKKVQKPPVSPHPIEYESSGYIDVERPKTPDPVILPPHPTHPSMPFGIFPHFTGPGLIPPPLANPLFSTMPLFGMPSIPPNCMPRPTHPQIPINFIPPPMKPPPHPEENIVRPPAVPPKAPSPIISIDDDEPEEIQVPILKPEKKTKEHKKEKKDKIKKKNKKDKLKNKADKKKLKEEKKDKIKKEKKEKRKDKETRDNLEISIPKLTLKLGTPSPRPDTQKLNIKPVIKKDVDEKPNEVVEIKRELSPELARISALVTGQPKPKAQPSTPNINPFESFQLQTKKSMFRPHTNIRPKELKREPVDEIPVSTSIQSKYIEEIKEEVVPASIQKTHPGPGRPRIHAIKKNAIKSNKRQVPVKDSEGNEVWICPACGRQDDGSPMIGCDDCDAWYHWVCVGIQVPPDENEDWYCRHCIVKKQEVLQSDKKKKRKKREKKEH